MSFGPKQLPPPKSGNQYRLLSIGRISTEMQNEMALDDQVAFTDEWAKDDYGTNFKMDSLCGRGSGQDLSREEYLELWERVDSGVYDAIIAEDLGRIARRVHAMIFCEAGEDSDR